MTVESPNPPRLSAVDARIRKVNGCSPLARSHAGFTLVEMVTSLAILAILCTALTSVMVLAARATSASTTGATLNSMTSATAAARIASDLKVALSITEQTSTALTFTVPDRNNDGQPETLRYAWAGAGNPLTLQINGGTAMNVATNVQNLKFTYLTRSVGRASPPAGTGTVESSEALLMSHDNSGGTMSDFTVNKDNECANYVKPEIPANAISWKVTRVKIMAKQSGPAKEALAIDLRTPTTANKPANSSIESIGISESALPTGYTSWAQATFSNASGLDPAKGICIVVRQTSGGAPCCILNWESGTTETDNRYMTTSDGEDSWSTPSTGQHMRFYLYGTITTPAP